MDSKHRHQLKEDRFKQVTMDQVHWAVEHRNTVITTLVVVAVLGTAVIGGLAYLRKQDNKASAAFGSAMRVYNAPVAKTSTEADPTAKTFTTSKERGQAAEKEFSKVADEFGNTTNGKYARYMAGIAALEAGDNATAEKHLKETAGKGGELGALGKFALASYYRGSGRDKDAVELLKQVVAADSVAVPKATAQLELASVYEAQKQHGEAMKIYEEIKRVEEESAKKDAESEKKTASKDKKAAAPSAPAPKSPLTQLAEQKIAQLKQASAQ